MFLPQTFFLENPWDILPGIPYQTFSPSKK